MVEAKTTTKKATPKAAVSTVEQLLTKRNDLHELKKTHASGELVNPRVLKATRKEIARLLTAKRAEELSAKESK